MGATGQPSFVTLSAAKGLVACVKEILGRYAPQNDSCGARPATREQVIPS